MPLIKHMLRVVCRKNYGIVWEYFPNGQITSNRFLMFYVFFVSHLVVYPVQRFFIWFELVKTKLFSSLQKFFIWNG